MALILNDKQEEALSKAKLGRNLFITGAGGVGKSVVIHKLEEMFKGTCLLLAPTGVAALNIGGATLHRTFGLPFSIATEDDSRRYTDLEIELFRDNDYVKTIIIDEISMVRSDYLITIDMKLRHLKRKPKVPFGGVQVIVVGDFFQLPPVLTDREAEAYYELYPSIFCFDTDTWDECEFDVMHLTQVMRQEDAITARAFNSIRHGKQNPNVLKWLNNIASKNSYDPNHVVLCTTNSRAGELNGERYDEIDSEEFMFSGKINGDFRDRPVDSLIRLKEGTKVVMCANNAAAGYMNGSSGTIESLGSDEITVALDSGTYCQISKNIWEQYEYGISGGKLSKNVVGSFEQYPIKLGYAITIHKSQGMTLDGVRLDFGRGCFAHGQAYVGLSRVRSLNNMTMERPIRQSDIIVDEDVIDFMAELGI